MGDHGDGCECRPLGFLIGLPFALLALILSLVGAVIWVIGSVLSCLCPCCICCTGLANLAELNDVDLDDESRKLDFAYSIDGFAEVSEVGEQFGRNSMNLNGGNTSIETAYPLMMP